MFGLFKKKKKDVIELKQDISGYLVFPYLLKRDVIHLGRKVIVPEECLLAIAGRGRVFDVLAPGQHILNPVTMPHCAKKQKLYRIGKHGLPPTAFYGYLYYINLAKIQNFPFETYKRIKYKNATDGKFWVNIHFSLSLQIVDPQRLMKAMLSELAILRGTEPEKIVAGWLGEVVTDFLAKQKLTKAQFARKNINELLELLAEKIANLTEKIGLRVFGLKVLEVEMPKVRSKNQNKNPLLNDEKHEGYLAFGEKGVEIDKLKKLLEHQEEKTKTETNHEQQNQQKTTENKKEWSGWEKFLKK